MKTADYPPLNEDSREVENLTESKNQDTQVYVVKEFVCLSTNSTPIISGLAEQNGLKKKCDKKITLARGHWDWGQRPKLFLPQKIVKWVY